MRYLTLISVLFLLGCGGKEAPVKKSEAPGVAATEVPAGEQVPQVARAREFSKFMGPIPDKAMPRAPGAPAGDRVPQVALEAPAGNVMMGPVPDEAMPRKIVYNALVELVVDEFEQAEEQLR
jgi:hypothetical protein